MRYYPRIRYNTLIPRQINKLAELKEQGILTEEEFTCKKFELLAKMQHINRSRINPGSIYIFEYSERNMESYVECSI
jgi:hypothetical protein